MDNFEPIDWTIKVERPQPRLVSEYFDIPHPAPFTDSPLRRTPLMDRVSVRELLQARRCFVLSISDAICNYSKAHRIALDMMFTLIKNRSGVEIDDLRASWEEVVTRNDANLGETTNFSEHDFVSLLRECLGANDIDDNLSYVTYLLRKYQATLLGEIRFHDGSHDFLTLCQAMKKDIFFISKGVLRPRDFMVRMGIDMEGINCIREGEVDAENENIFRRISRKFGHDLDKFIYIGEEKDVVKARETGMTGVLLDRSLEECRLECTPFAVQNTMAINSLKILTNWLKW